MEYIRPRCCMCGELCEPIRKSKYRENDLYFCGKGIRSNSCILRYWGLLSKQCLEEKMKQEEEEENVLQNI